MFDTLIELNSIIADGFLMNKIILLFRKKQELNSDDSISEENLIILKNTLRYIELIKNGRDFIIDNNNVKDLDESLNAFNTSLNALDQTEKDLTIERFNKIINISEDQIEESIESRKIIGENLDISLILFESIRKYLIKEADKINIDEQSIF